MYEKPLLNMYQTSSKHKQEREKKSNHELDKYGKRGELTRTPKSDQEKKFQNNRKVLARVPQAEID
jgi:hypothetical protein